MKSYVFGSVRPAAGKTTLLVGLAKALGTRSCGFFKPLGDHLVYRKKTLWDLDGALMKDVLSADFDSQEFTVGFDHSKMKYTHDRSTLGDDVRSRAGTLSKGREWLFIEGPGTLEHGHSLGLDSVGVSLLVGCPLVVVLRGSPSQVMDDASFAMELAAARRADLKGFVVNDIHNLETFAEEVLPELKELKASVLAAVGHGAGLADMRVSFVADRLFAKVVAGEAGLNRHVSQIFVGAMAASSARRHPGWKDPSKLIITAGDRDDLIAAAVDDGASCLVITNDLVPAPAILAKADLRGVPILQVPTDTYSTARKLETIESVMQPEEREKLDQAEGLVRASGLDKALL